MTTESMGIDDAVSTVQVSTPTMSAMTLADVNE